MANAEFHNNSKHAAPASAWLPLLYDTVIIILTLYRTSEIRAPAKKNSSGGRLLSVMRQEGLTYYR